MEPRPSRADFTPDQHLASLDRILNVVVHPDWSEVYLRFTEEAATARTCMEQAKTWEEFVAARAVYLYLQERVLPLQQQVMAEREALESVRDAGDAPRIPAEMDPYQL